MAFALLIIGAFLLVSSVKGTQGDLAKLLKGDFTQPPSFIYWMASIFIIGAIGYVPKLKGLSTMFLALVVLVLFLKKGDPTGIGGGFFSQFSSALGTTTQAAQGTTPASAPVAASPLAIPSLGPGVDLGNLPIGTPPFLGTIQ